MTSKWGSEQASIDLNRARRPRGLKCPYCKEDNTQRLGGGVVWECYDCGAAFNKETVSHEDDCKLST